MGKEQLETQGQILDAAMHHFAEAGYRGASMSKIAALAGVSKSLIFWYFNSKSSLFQSLIDRFVQSCRDTLTQSGPAGDAQTKIEKFIDVYWAFICENLHFVRIFMNWFMQLSPNEREKTKGVRAIHREFQQIFSEYLQEGVDQGIFREDLDIAFTTLFLVSTLEGLLLQLLVQEVDPQKLEKEFFCSLKKNLMLGLIKRTTKLC